MTQQTIPSLRRNARVAGFLYLLLSVAAPIRLIYIPSRLVVSGSASATATNIASHESLFRLGMIADVFSGVMVVFLVLALYRLFEDVDRRLALLMLIVGGIVPATIDFVNVVNDGAALILVRGADFLSAFDTPQRDALATLFLRLHGQVVVAAETLWGLWLFPFGLLVIRSGFLPRFLGGWLIVNGAAYLAQSFTGLFLPRYEGIVSSVTFPALLGEIATMLWLLIVGARVRGRRDLALRADA